MPAPPAEAARTMIWSDRKRAARARARRRCATARWRRGRHASRVRIFMGLLRRLGLHSNSMECPRDHSTLKTELYEGKVEVDKCPSCRGMWLDAGELEAIQDASERRHLHLGDAPGDSVERSINEVAQLAAKDAKCPRCGTPMVPRDYGFGSQIVIDTCPSGCGVWLDVGESERLEAFYEQSHADAGSVLPAAFWLRERFYSLFGKKRR